MVLLVHEVEERKKNGDCMRRAMLPVLISVIAVTLLSSFQPPVARAVNVSDPDTALTGEFDGNTITQAEIVSVNIPAKARAGDIVEVEVTARAISVELIRNQYQDFQIVVFLSPVRYDPNPWYKGITDMTLSPGETGIVVIPVKIWANAPGGQYNVDVTLWYPNFASEGISPTPIDMKTFKNAVDIEERTDRAEYRTVVCETEWQEEVGLDGLNITISNNSPYNFTVVKVALLAGEFVPSTMSTSNGENRTIYREVRQDEETTVWTGRLSIESHSKEDLVISNLWDIYEASTPNNVCRVYIEESPMSPEFPEYFHNIVILNRSMSTYPEGHTHVLSTLHLLLKKGGEKPGATLAQLIKQETTHTIPVTVDGQQYYIVTLRRNINPATLEVVPGSLPSKVYVDLQGNPVSDEDVAQRIGVIDQSRRWAEGIGSASNILQDIAAMETRWTIHRQIEWLGFSLELLPATAAISLRTYLTSGSSISKDLLATVSKMFLAHASNPGWILENIAFGNFSEAEDEYRKAIEVATSIDDIDDYETASAYFEHLFGAYANDYSARQLLNQIDQIDKSTLAELAELGASFSASLVGVNYGLFQSLMDSLLTLPLTYSYLNTWDQWRSNLDRMILEPSYYARYTLTLATNDPTLMSETGSNRLWTVAEVGSPIELRVYDSIGRITGIVGGEFKSEIPNSSYYNDIVKILFPSDSFSYEVFGTNEGSYSLAVTAVAESASTFSIADTSTSVGAMHKYTIDWDTLAKGEKGVTMRIDSDGDGTFERTLFLSSSGKAGQGILPLVWYVAGAGVLLAVVLVAGLRLVKKRASGYKSNEL